jgi:hypothetical protein
MRKGTADIATEATPIAIGTAPNVNTLDKTIEETARAI